MPVKLKFIHPLFIQSHLFIIFSYLFLFLQHQNCVLKPFPRVYLLLYGIGTIISLIILHYGSKLILLLHGANFLFVTGKCLEYFILYQHNWTLIFTLAFWILYIFYLIFLSHDLQRCILNPHFHPYDLSFPGVLYLPVKIIQGEWVKEGLLASWGPLECVIYFPEGEGERIPSREKFYTLKISYQEKEYESLALEATGIYSGLGLGFILVDQKRNYFSKNTLADLFYLLERRLAPDVA